MFKRKYLVLLVVLFVSFTSKSYAINLIDACNMAVSYNPGYLSKKYEYKASSTYKMQGLSYLLPQISFSANRSKYDFLMGPYYYANYMANTYSLNAQQYLFNLSNFAMYKELNTRAKMGEYKFKDAQAQLIYNVAQAYFDNLSALDELKLREIEKKLLTKLLNYQKNCIKLVKVHW